jgi:hypothetical protein
MQMVTLDYAKVATRELELKRIPSNTKTRFETHIGIKVLYIKCWQTLKSRNVTSGKNNTLGIWSFGWVP